MSFPTDIEEGGKLVVPKSDLKLKEKSDLVEQGSSQGKKCHHSQVQS